MKTSWEKNNTEKNQLDMIENFKYIDTLYNIHILSNIISKYINIENNFLWKKKSAKMSGLTIIEWRKVAHMNIYSCCGQVD